MDEKEILLAMKRIRKIEEEARRRLLKEEEAKTRGPSGSKPKVVPKVSKSPIGAKINSVLVNAIPPPLQTREEVKAAKAGAKASAKTPVLAPKKKKEAIPAAVKTLVWNKWVGEKEAETGCYCCRVTTISMRHFHCGHVVSEKHGGKCTIDNLRPVCANCNLSMGTMDMREYIEKFGLHK